MVHKNNCVVSIIMGSDSDWKILEKAADALGMFDIGYEVEVVSAHRTPHKLVDFSTHAHERGIKVIIAGAGGAAHLPGMVASLTILPVIAVPVALKNLMGIDSLLSIVQMPAGVPVGTMSIDGAFNAGLYAVRILALNDPQLQQEVEKYHLSLKEIVEEKNALLHQQHAQRDA